ncbi:MAG: hypothetical protein ACT4R6_02220 [Gemmatimonadaceae bacterium]
MCAVATLGLAWSLVSVDLSLRYVAEHTTTNLPLPYRLAALWDGAAGIAIVMSLAVSGVAAWTLNGGARPADGRGSVVAVLAGTALVACAVSALGAPPFARLPWLPLEGEGLSPRLQSFAAALAPPLLIVAYALLIPPAVLALAPAPARGARTARGSMTHHILGAYVLQTSAVALGAWSLRQAGRPAGYWPWIVGAVWLLTGAMGAVALRRSAIRRWLAALAMAGVLTLGAAFAALAVSRDMLLTLRPGESGYVVDAFGSGGALVHQGVSAYRVRNREVTAVTLQASVGSARPTLLVAERWQYVDGRGEATHSALARTAVHSGMLQDVSATLLSVERDDAVAIRLAFRPLAWLLWLGLALLLSAGALGWLAALRRAPNVQ